MKKSSTTDTFIIFQTLFSKGIFTFVDPMPSFTTYDGKRFAEKLDRYITTIVFKSGRRFKYIIWKSLSVY